MKESKKMKTVALRRPRGVAAALWFAGGVIGVFQANAAPPPGTQPAGTVAVIDQEQTVSGSGHNVAIFGPFGQSFTPTVPFIDFFEVYLDDNGSGDATLDFSLFSGEGFGGMNLGTFTQIVPDGVSDADPTRFIFGATIPLVPGNLYTFRIDHMGGNSLSIQGNFDGMSYPDGIGFPFGGYDLRFATGYFVVAMTPPAGATPAGAGPSGSNATAPDSFVITDLGAINSLFGSGLPFGHFNRQLTQNAAQNPLTGLDDFRLGEIFTDGFESGDVSAWSRNRGADAGGDRALLPYLNFAARQGIDSRVALGLADGETVVVADTLAAHDTLWASNPFAMVGGPVALPVMAMKAVVAVPEGGGKNPVADKTVIEEGPRQSRLKLFSEFDFGFYDQDRLTRSVAGFETDSYAGSLGLNYRLLSWLQVGGAFTHLWSDSEIARSLGSVDVEGQILSAWATAFLGQSFADVRYSYGDLNNELTRDTLLGRSARGDTDSDFHNVAVRLGHRYAIGERIIAGPFAGLNYTTGEIDGYAETGGGSANLLYPEDDFESMIGRLGWQVTHQGNLGSRRLTSRISAAWAHEFMPENDAVGASLATSPFILVSGGTARRVGGFGASADGAHAGTDWLELGAGVDIDLFDDWDLSLDYQGQFARNNASAHFAGIKLEYEW